jgi:arabinooligosaccharide transport system substrate-binding protein
LAVHHPLIVALVFKWIQQLDLPVSRESLSVGGWIICALAVVSSVAVLAWPIPQHEGLSFWIFSRPHGEMYKTVVEEWNESQTTQVRMSLISNEAMQQRMLAAFLSDTPSSDLIEVERNFVPQVFTGPIEDVGFVDLTDRLHEEGIYDKINEPSFSPWSSRGRIFGLPHDVHPVMLAYRVDVFESAGIDIEAVQTWDEFARAVRPLVGDRDNDGSVDYVIGFWASGEFRDQIEALILQAGGALFDEADRMRIDTPVNARVLATLASWMVGPDRIAVDAPEFNANANKMRLDGRVVVAIMPDWLCGVWQTDLPRLSGKFKLMPLPAWEPGGRRTTVWGGTMLGIAKTTEDPQGSWGLAKHLYLSESLAESLYRTNRIISPVRSYWDRSFYDEPVDYFKGQPIGRMFIDMAPDIPKRTSSPFNTYAKDRVVNALYLLKEYANTKGRYTPDELLDEAHRLLEEAEGLVQREVDRNVFLRSEP